MSEIREEELIYDWNKQEGTWPSSPPLLIDHSLSAARFAPSARVPRAETQLDLLAAAGQLGIQHFCLGNWEEPGVQQVALRAEHPGQRYWVEVGGEELPPGQFSLYISQKQPQWQGLLRRAGARATLVLQDVSRVHPEILIDRLMVAVEARAEAVCLCDDGGRSTPAGTDRLVRFAVDAVERAGAKMRVEWSGRNDRCLALANAAAAWRAGAGGIHCAFFGLGEGSGLVPTELLLVNLSLLGAVRRDLRALGEVSRKMSEGFGVELFSNLPVVGADAFRTGTGVHAAAIMKAQAKGHEWLADLIYSGVPASQFGFSQRIEVGPMAGASNVVHWLRERGLEQSPELVQLILQEAKSGQRVLQDDELMAIVQRS